MRILFVCKYNAGRSQIAEGFFNKVIRNKSLSAGIKARERINHPMPDFVIKCMQEKKINMARNYRKQLTKEMAEKADKIIMFVPKRMWPKYLKNSKKTTYWRVADAKGKSYSFHCNIRDQIQKRVINLLKELK